MYVYRGDNDDKRWWDEDVKKDDLPERIFALISQLDDDQERKRREKNTAYIKAYENRKILGARPNEYRDESDGADYTLNGISACIDTLASKIAIIKPKPMFLTVEGDFSEQQQAKGLQKFTMGNFQHGGVYSKNKDVFLDAGVCDIGAMKAVEKDGAIDYERVWPDEIVVDEQAALNADPRELFQRKYVPRDILCGLYPDEEDEIRESGAPSLSQGETATKDVVEVVEAWHLPTGADGDNGRHCICVQECCLLDEGWDEERFPFAFLRWNKRRRGFYGQGLAEQLYPLQDELTNLMDMSQTSMELLGVPWVIVPESSDIASDTMDNEIGRIIRCKGPGEPHVQTHNSISPEVMQRIIFIFEKMFEISGLSQLSATSRKPAGIESGVALRTLLDTETQRFALLVDAWQEFHLELARVTVMMGRRIAKENGDYSVVFNDKTLAKKIKFSEVNLSEDRYVLQLWPVNLLPDTPAGKLAYVEQMITIGLIQPDQGRSLLNYPDIEAFRSLDEAGEEDIKYLIDHMTTTGEYVPPEPYEPLELGIRVMQSARLRGKIDGWPDEKLEILTRWMDDANSILNDAEQAAQMQQAAMQGPPPGQPPGPPEMPPGPPPGPPMGVPPGPPPGPEMPV